MGFMLKVAMLDLLVERTTFGHEGNLQIVNSLTQYSDVEVWLLTPQMQEGGVGDDKPKLLRFEEVPLWEGDFAFSSEEVLISANEGSGNIVLRRMALPESKHVASWLENAQLDAVYCTGSRRNVSMWEGWMESAAELLRQSVNFEIPTLGICFGHQLLCHALGGEVERAESKSELVCDLEKTGFGSYDQLFDGIGNLRGLFTHQDHVVKVPEDCIVLATSEHSQNAAIRVCKDEKMLEAYGVQFHPEAYPELIQRSLEAGYLTLEESNQLHGEHDGRQILSNFASVVHSMKK